MNHRLMSATLVLSLIVTLHAQPYPYPDAAELARAKAGELILKPGIVQGYAADFGMLVVPENRTSDASRLIHLPVVRIHSRREPSLEPVFTLEGGPGGTNIKLEPVRDWLLENHDLVMVGYRGVDGSVSLNCPEITAALKTVADPLSAAGLKELGDAMTRAAKRLQDEGVDLPEYDIINVVDDIEAARKALGYRRIDLSSGSYGCAVACTYCMRYPESLHRNLMVEPAFPWDIGVAEPGQIDANFERLNALWKQDPQCLEKSKDIVETVRSVLKTLPRSWRGVGIDPGRVKLVTFLALYNRNTTNQALDAFVAAERGDYSGLAFMAAYWGQIVDWFNWGDLLAKTYCTQTNRTRDYEIEMDPPDSVIGSPLSKLGWSLLKYGDWPHKPLSMDYRTPRETEVDTLLVWGVKGDDAEDSRKYAGCFKRGQIVLLKDMGHMDVGSLAPQAAHHLEKRFFREGVADASMYDSVAAQPRDFVPRPSFQDMAGQMLPPPPAEPEPNKPYVVLERGDVRAVIVNNEAVDDAVLPGHRAGYSGVASLTHKLRRENLFVPAYAGLNFEHIHDGTTQPRDVLFEPRQAPMTIRRVGPYAAELRQPPTPHWQLESRLRYELLEDGTIEVTVECIPRARTFKNGYIGLFFASYIHQPESLDIHFLGVPSDERNAKPQWIRGVTPAHGVLATHPAVDDDRQFAHDEDFPLSLVFSLSNHRYSEPWYYGVSHDMAFVQMFRPKDQVRLSQSPSGGGEGNPAWDFQWFIPQYEVGRPYRFVMRAMYLPFESRDQVVRATASHRADLSEP